MGQLCVMANRVEYHKTDRSQTGRKPSIWGDFGVVRYSWNFSELGRVL